MGVWPVAEPHGPLAGGDQHELSAGRADLAGAWAAAGVVPVGQRAGGRVVLTADLPGSPGQAGQGQRGLAHAPTACWSAASAAWRQARWRRTRSLWVSAAYTPYSPVSSAWMRHHSLTGQPRQTCLALAIITTAPAPSWSIVNHSGSTSGARQAARRVHGPSGTIRAPYQGSASTAEGVLVGSGIGAHLPGRAGRDSSGGDVRVVLL